MSTRGFRSKRFRAVVAKAIDNAPPLTDDQILRLSRLLASTPNTKKDTQ